MAGTEWLKILIPVFTSSLVVWFLTTLYNRRQGRVQIVNTQLRITSVDLRPKNVPQGAQVTTTVQAANGPQLIVDTLYAVECVLQNTTNKDFATFSFGVSFPRYFYITDEDIKPPDRYHTYDISMPSAPRDANHHERDFRVAPFTRGDRYILRYTLAPADNYIYNGGDPQVFTLTEEKHILNRTDFVFGTPETGVRLSINEGISKAAYWRDNTIYIALVLAIVVTGVSALISFLVGNIFNPSRMTLSLIVICLSLTLFMTFFAPRYERKYNRKQDSISISPE